MCTLHHQSSSSTHHWNKVPQSIACLSSSKAFKSSLKSYFLFWILFCLLNLCPYSLYNSTLEETAHFVFDKSFRILTKTQDRFYCSSLLPSLFGCFSEFSVRSFYCMYYSMNQNHSNCTLTIGYHWSFRPSECTSSLLWLLQASMLNYMSCSSLQQFSIITTWSALLAWYKRGGCSLVWLLVDCGEGEPYTHTSVDGL